MARMEQSVLHAHTSSSAGSSSSIEKQVLACGAQAASVYHEQEGPCYYVQHFKMHLHPKRIVEENNLPSKGQIRHILVAAYINSSATGALQLFPRV